MYHSVGFLNVFVKMNNLCPIFLIHLCYSTIFDLYNPNLYSITRKFLSFFGFEEILILERNMEEEKYRTMHLQKRERKNAL